MTTRYQKNELYPADLVPSLLTVPWTAYKSGRKCESTGPDSFPIYPEDPLKGFHQLISQYLTETADQKSWMIDPLAQPAGSKLLAGSPLSRGQAILAAAARVAWFCKTPRWNKDFKSWAYEDQRLNGLQPLLASLFLAETELTAGQTIELASFLGGPMSSIIAEHIPPLGVVLAVEKSLAAMPLPPEYQRSLVKLARWLITKTLPQKRAAEFARVWRRIGAYEKVRELDDPNQAFQRLAAMILDEQTLIELVGEMMQPLEDLGFYARTGAPLASFLDLLESYLTSHTMPGPVRDALAKIQHKMESGRLPKDEQKTLGRIRSALGGTGATEIEPGEAWSEQARADLASFTRKQRDAWNGLLAHCVTAEA